ncbi:hypothetical protein TRFO_19124 [Tritrichomonas foetus]|uniref:Uncharacterized protein n=1 Tax=Tritrichomonas foetus TaxID=1144522 RepID=A0A1J4KJ82_9EUKA|nr:hypothetical protein TRFO_19124 [Tritrichomonas foetus]|eukprot:OHT11399.1 hypothetical protein TRFO_19124 [Tritrichomonas foetus]
MHNEQSWAIEGIRQIAFGELKKSKLFFTTENVKSNKKLFQALTQSQIPPIINKNKVIVSPAHFRWVVYCFASRFNVECQIDDFYVIQPRFLSYSSFKAQQIRSFLNYTDLNDDIQAKLDFALTYIDFIEEDKPLSIWIHPHIISIFESIDYLTLYQHLGYDMFLLYNENTNINKQEIKMLDFCYCKDKKFLDFLMIPLLYKKPKIMRIIEHSLINKYLYPLFQPFDKNESIELSFINTSLVTQQHFLDVYFSYLKKIYLRGNYEDFSTLSEFFDQFQPWIIIFILNTRYVILPSCFEEFSFPFENPCTDFLNRLYSDRILFQRIRQLTGTNKTLFEFLNHSLPYNLFYGMNMTLEPYYQPFEDLYSNKYYCISDLDMEIDHDFVHQYFTLSIIMECIGSNDNTTRNTQMQQCEWFINTIINDEKKLVIKQDILSLIFLKKNNQYACSYDLAISFINLLLTIDNNSNFASNYIIPGYKKMNLIRCLDSNLLLENVISPTKYKLLEALLFKDYDIAKYLSSISVENDDLYCTYNDVHNYSINQHFVPASHKLTAVKEISLSYDNQSNNISYVIPYCNDIIEIKVLQKRHNQKIWIEFPQYPNVIKQLSDFDSNKWMNITFTENLPLLSTFCNTLNSFIPISLKSQLGDTVEDVLRLNPSKTIIKLLKSHLIEDANTIAEKKNQDLHEIIYSRNDYPIDIVMHYFNEYPQISYCQLISSNFYLDECMPRVLSRVLVKRQNIVDNEIIHFTRKKIIAPRIINQNKINTANSYHRDFIETIYTSLNDLHEYLRYLDNISQNGTLEYELTEILRHALRISPLQVDFIADISYRMRKYVFKNIIFSQITCENICIFKKVLNDCLFDTTDIDFLIHIKRIYEIDPFPIDLSFTILVDISQYALAKQMYEYFPKYANNFDNILIQKTKQLINDEGNIKDILISFPQIKNNVYAFLSHKQMRIYNSEYQDFLLVIPNDWDNNGSPNEILSREIMYELNLKSSETKDIIVNLLNSFSFVNCDKDIISYLDAYVCKNKYYTDFEKIYQLSCSLTSFESLFREKHILTEFVLGQIIFIVFKTENSLQNETIYEILLFRKCIYVLKRNKITEMYPNFLLKLEILSQILLRQYNTKYHDVICFHDFFSSRSGYLLADFCNKYDSIDLLNQIGIIWEIDISGYMENRVTYAYELSLFENNGINLPEVEMNLTSKPEQIYRRNLVTEKVVNILSKNLFYDPDIVQSLFYNFPPLEHILGVNVIPPKSGIKSSNTDTKISIFKNLTNVSASQMHTEPDSTAPTMKYLYKRIKFIIKKRVEPNRIQLLYLYKFIETKASFEKQVKYYSENFELDNAISLIEKCPNNDKKAFLFENYLFKTCIEYDNIERLRNRMYNLPDYVVTYLSKLFFLTKNDPNALYLKLEIAQFLHLYDDAIETAIQLYNETFSNIQSLNLLDIAQVNIEMILNELKEKSSIHDNGLYSKYDIKSVSKYNDYLKKIDQQRKYCMFLLEKKIAGGPNLSVFKYSVNFEPMTVLLFKEKYFDLGLDFMTQYNISIETISEKVVDIIITYNEQSLIQYIRSLEDNCPNDIFRDIFYSMLNRITYVFLKSKVASKIIKESLQDSHFKCALMIQYYMIEEAAEIPFKIKDNEMIAMVANLASIHAKTSILNKCYKYFGI